MKNYYEYEELSITVVKKINKKKVLILLLALLLVLALIFAFVFSIHKKMVEIRKENNDLIENDVIINTEEEEEQEEETTNVSIKLPELTQIGRDNVSNIYKAEEKTAYITFDDGPSSNITPQILNILEQYEIKATFFVLGCNVERYPDLVKQEYEAGHYIANHGYSHVYTSIYSSSQAVLDEYTRTEQIVRDAIGIQEYSGHLFRFPGGSMGTKYKNIKNEAKQLLSDNDIMYVDWNALTNDAVGTPTSESIMQNLVDTVGTKNSVVILMHDASSKQLTADMLPQVLDYLIGQGYTFKNFYDVIM